MGPARGEAWCRRGDPPVQKYHPKNLFFSHQAQEAVKQGNNGGGRRGGENGPVVQFSYFSFCCSLTGCQPGAPNICRGLNLYLKNSGLVPALPQIYDIGQF